MYNRSRSLKPNPSKIDLLVIMRNLQPYQKEKAAWQKGEMFFKQGKGKSKTTSFLNKMIFSTRTSGGI